MTDKKQVSTVDSKKLSLVQRVAAVRAEVPTIEHDKWVGTYKQGKPDPDDRYGYWVTTHQAVNKVLKPLLDKYGLIDYVSELAGDNVDTGRVVGRNNTPMMQYRARFMYFVQNIDQPEEVLTIEVSGFGDDTGDKGPGKATTYALKTGRAKVFSFTTGDDEEGRPQDQKAAPVPTISAEEFDALLQLVDGYYGDDQEEFLQRFGENILDRVFNVHALSEIPEGHFEHAKKLIVNQAKRENKTMEEATL